MGQQGDAKYQGKEIVFEKMRAYCNNMRRGCEQL